MPRSKGEADLFASSVPDSTVSSLTTRLVNLLPTVPAKLVPSLCGTQSEITGPFPVIHNIYLRCQHICLDTLHLLSTSAYKDLTGHDN